VSCQLEICTRLIRLTSTAFELFPTPAVTQERQAIRLWAVTLPSEVSTCLPLLIIIANLDHSVRFAHKASLEQHRLQHEEQDMAFEQQRREALALDLPTYRTSIGLTIPPTMPSLTFQNGDAIVWDALPCDDIDTILARLTQAPNPDLIPCPTTPNQCQSQVRHRDRQQDVNLSGLAHQPVQQPCHDWPLPPVAPRPSWSFLNYYIDDSFMAYNDDG
jgi:hypothetical protein